MPRYGKKGTFQFAIASGSESVGYAKATVLKAPPGEGWDLIHIEFTSDWLTVWRRQHNDTGAVREAEEVQQNLKEAAIRAEHKPAESKDNTGGHAVMVTTLSCDQCGAPTLDKGDGKLTCTSCGVVTPRDEMKLECGCKAVEGCSCYTRE